MKELIALIALLFATIQAANAQNLQTTGPVSSMGRGCPNRDVSVTWTPDMGAFSILFDNLKAETTQAGADNRNCKVSIPLRIDSGWRLRLIQVDHRGFLNLGAGDRGQLIANYQFKGGRVCNDERCRRSVPTELRRDYVGPYSGDLLETIYSQSEWQFSSCGGDIQLEIDTRLRVGARGPGSGALMVLDSIDGALDANAIYRLSFERCQETMPQPPPRPGPRPIPGPRPGPRPLPPRFR